MTTRIRRGLTEGQWRNAVHEAAGHLCQVQVEGCNGRSAHAHHILRRSQGGGFDLANGKAACDWCHSYIHSHPAESYIRGWLRRRNPRPGDFHYQGDEE